jgi:DNA-binding response OmpR family regulator
VPLPPRQGQRHAVDLRVAPVVEDNGVEESVIEGHVSKLRKKLAERLGYDPIEAKRYMGYTYG